MTTQSTITVQELKTKLVRAFASPYKSGVLFDKAYGLVCDVALKTEGLGAQIATTVMNSKRLSEAQAFRIAEAAFNNNIEF